ncbi:hypothetical protein Q5692_19870 [Microcoleus sp. C2C3]
MKFILVVGAVVEVIENLPFVGTQASQSCQITGLTFYIVAVMVDRDSRPR